MIKRILFDPRPTHGYRGTGRAHHHPPSPNSRRVPFGCPANQHTRPPCVIAATKSLYLIWTMAMARNRSAAVPNNARIVWKGGASEVEMGCTEHMVELVQRGGGVQTHGEEERCRPGAMKTKLKNIIIHLIYRRRETHRMVSIPSTTTTHCPWWYGEGG